MVIWDVLAMRPEAARHARVAADDVRSGNWKHTLRIALCDVFANSWGALNKSQSSFAHPARCTFLISSLGRCRAGWWSRPHRLFLSGSCQHLAGWVGLSLLSSAAYQHTRSDGPHDWNAVDCGHTQIIAPQHPLLASFSFYHHDHDDDEVGHQSGTITSGRRHVPAKQLHSTPAVASGLVSECSRHYR
jgi:hypothetical protein